MPEEDGRPDEQREIQRKSFYPPPQSSPGPEESFGSCTMGSRGAGAEDLVPRQLLIDANETVARLRNQLDEAAVRGRYEPCKLPSAPQNRITGASKCFGTQHEQQALPPAWVAGIDTGVHVGHVLGLHLIPSGLPLKFPGAAEQIHRVCVCLPQSLPSPPLRASRKEMEEAMRSTQFQIKTLQGQYKTTEVQLLHSSVPLPGSGCPDIAVTSSTNAPCYITRED